MLRERFLFTEFHPLHRTTVALIQERLRGANGDALVLGMHQRHESLNGLCAVIASNVSDFCRNLRRQSETNYNGVASSTKHQSPS